MTRAVNASLGAVALAAALALAPVSVRASGDGPHIERETWSFGGFSGQYDPAQLQRGFQIYKDVCSACHGLKRVHFRNLVQPGGPGFPEDAVKTLAADWPNKITDGPDDAGKMFERPAKLFDPILGPYKNEKEARASQNGALPPDLSLIARARNVEYGGTFWAHPFSMLRDISTSYQEGGADYVHALLSGYEEKAPAYKRAADGRLHLLGADEVGDESAVERCASVTHGEEDKPDTCNKLQDGMFYNKVFPGHQIAMPPPLAKDNFVKYQNGSGSLDENTRDLAAFLSWTADPSLNDRKSIGWLVMIYLLVTTVLLYLGKKRLWSKIPH
jgi:cytochrome c1